MDTLRTMVAALVLAAYVGVLPTAASPTTPSAAPCMPSRGNVFTFSVDVHAGEFGAYTVAGCAGPSPTLRVKRGVEYTLLQRNATNWMHPLGLAYYPDGAHDEVPELEYPTPAECDETKFACNPGKSVAQAPLYCIDGACETYADWNNGITSGLDVYEPAFKLPRDAWTTNGGEGMYAVKLTIPRDSATAELFYFCHIHSGMSGKIVVGPANATALTPFNPLKIAFDPKTYYTEPSAFDNGCGTFGVGEYSGADGGMARMCPRDVFLCEPKNDAFSVCMQSLDCKMAKEMRVRESANPIVTFMRQMIPHHQNAVNMAKTLLKLGTGGAGYADEDTDIEALLMDMVATQSLQIQTMQGWLDIYAVDEPPAACPGVAE